MARQEGAVEISLHHARPIPEHMDSLGEGLLRVGTGRVVVLAQPGRAGRELHQVAARGGRLQPEDGHQGTRGADLDRPAKRLLEGDVGELLGLDDVALADDAVGEFAVRPLALGGQATLAFAPLLGQALVAPGPVPLSGALLRAASPVEVVGVGGAAGAVDRPLQARAPP
jgi:hypothetical protein